MLKIAKPQIQHPQIVMLLQDVNLTPTNRHADYVAMTIKNPTAIHHTIQILACLAHGPVMPGILRMAPPAPHALPENIKPPLVMDPATIAPVETIVSVAQTHQKPAPKAGIVLASHSHQAPTPANTINQVICF
jgi:hypothetical protein